MATVRLLYAAILFDFVTFNTAQAIEVRLQGSLFNHAGRLEVRMGGGAWGTVCDDSFDHNAASVVCNMLGQGGDGTVVAMGMIGPGSGSIWLDDVVCEGSEPSLADCDHAGWGEHDCSHAEDVAITCQPNPLPVRLVGSGVPWEGRLEVYVRGQWGTVLYQTYDRRRSGWTFDAREAQVACHMLGFERRGLMLFNFYGPGQGRVWLDYSYCQGTEDSLVYCSHADFNIVPPSYNTHYYDASIYCRPGGNCTDELPGCTTIWNINVRSVYLRMVNGLLQPDELQAVCSNWSLCIANVNDTGCTFEDLYRLVYYNNSHYMGSLPHYNGDFYPYYNLSTQTLLPYLCDTMMPVYLSYQQCYNTLPLQNFTTDCDNFLTRARRYPYYLQLNDCKWRLYLARCYARAWLKSCSWDIAVKATRLFLYAVRNVYFRYTSCTYDDRELLDPTILEPSSHLALIGLHAKPDKAVEEMQALADVHAAVEEHWNTDNILIIGDLNAECSYASQSELASLTLRTDSRFSWHIGDEVDTTTKSTDCAYDRLIASGEELRSSILQSSAGVFRFDLEYQLNQDMTEDVSDHYPVEVLIQSKSGPVLVGAFNIQVFGRTKVGKEDVLSILVKIVKRYDILLIQEIRDIELTTMDTLLDAVNTDIGIPDFYKHTMSERLGRTSSKEQYSYVYRSDRVTLVDTYQYDDSADDVFEREPYCVLFFLNGTADDNELLVPSVLNQFKEEQYISCVTQEPLMSVWYYAYRMFDYMLACSYSSSTVISRCSDWSDFTSCLSTNDVTFDDMHQYLSTYQFNDYYYNGSIASYYFFCTHIEQYQTFEQCCQSGTTCQKIVAMKGRTPYNNIYSSCSRLLESQVCKYSDMESACDETGAQLYAYFYAKDVEIWKSTSCGINESVIVNTDLPDDANCSDYRYLKCLVASTLQYQLYSDNYKYFTELLKGTYGYPFGNPCSWLTEAIDCIGCKPWQSVFPTRAMYLERYYYRYGIADYLTPMRLYDLCRADEEDYIEYATCFEKKSIFNIFNFQCRLEAETAVQEESGYDYCNLYKYWGQCFYTAVSTLCSVPAADYVMMYLVDGWQPVLYHRYGCEFGCDFSPCVSDLPPLAVLYCELLSNGQLTQTHLMNLCTMTGEAVSCISSTVGSMCPNRLKYINLLRDMESFFCSATEQQAYLTNQACYVASPAASSVGDYCGGSSSCGERLQLLMSIFNDVNTACFAAAAKAVVSYMDHLKTLQGLETIVESDCPSMLYPGISPPTFSGPHIITKTCNGSEVTDFTFECRIHYKPATDDDTAMFDVVLTFDGVVDESTTKTITSLNKTVVFDSTDLAGQFGKTVSCAVRSYWQGLPIKSSYVPAVVDYFVGLKCYSENMIDDMIRIKESDPPTNVVLSPTVPVTCPPSEMSVYLDQSVGLYISECSVHFTDPLANETITVVALKSSSGFSRIARIVFSAISSPGSPWHGYIPAHCPVVIEDLIPSRCCYCRNDPRVTTFDGQHSLYSIYYPGDFLLWRSTAPGVTAEVHVRFRTCFRWDGSCACAVVFREDNNILGINACNPGSAPVLVTYLIDPVRPADDIQISSDGLVYTIKMPSGRTVTVRTRCRIFHSQNCFLFITLCVHADDAYYSEGLCGNYNYDYADDFIPKGWTTVDTNYLEPVLFTSSYMLKPWESLMNAHIYPPECVTVQPLQQAQCGCEHDQIIVVDGIVIFEIICDVAAPPEPPDKVIVVIVPGFTIITMVFEQHTVVLIVSPGVIIVFPPGVIIFIPPGVTISIQTASKVNSLPAADTSNPTPSRSYITGGTYQCFARRKRSVSSVDGDMLPADAIPPVEEGEIPGPEGLHPNATWPTASGITLEMATNSCVTPIRSLSIFSVCDEYTAEKMQPLIEGCTLDIQITDDVDASVMSIDSLFIELCIHEILTSDNRTVEEALAAYNESLFSGTDDNGNSSVTDVMSDAVREILAYILSQTCPGQPSCSGRGTCQNSVCTCSEGFTGADCYVMADLPPIVRRLSSPPTCTMRENNCNSLRVIADNFDMQTPIICKLVSDAGTFYTAATTTSGEVRCPIPVFPPDSNSTLQLYSWTVYLSVDNSTWSNGTQLFVYDALSVTCNETTMTCAPSEEGTCLILGRIYEVNDTRSVSSTCYKCLPENSLSAWSWDTAGCGPQIKCRPRPKGKWKKKWGKWKKYWKKAQKGPKLPWCKKSKDSSDDSDKGKGDKDKNKGKGGKSNDGSEKSGDSSDSSDSRQRSDEGSNSSDRSDGSSNGSDRSDERSNRRGSDRSRSDSDDSGSDSSS